IGDPGANAGDDAAIGVAPEAVAVAAAVGPHHGSAPLPHAPARRLGVEHLLERVDARLHAPRALPEIAQRFLVVAGEPPSLPPPRDVVEGDPDRRDDDEEDDAEDEAAAVEHDVHPLARGLRGDAIAEPLLECLQLLVDAVLRLEPGE